MPKPSTKLPKNETAWIRIDNIVDLPTSNPNRMSSGRYQKLKANIEKYGFLMPILVYRKGRSKKFVLSDGFHRRKAMTELGQEEIEAKIFKSRDDAEKACRILRIAMNQIRGEGSIDLLSEEIADLLSSGVEKLELEDTGVDADEIDAILECSDLDITSLLTDVAPADDSSPEESATTPKEALPRSHKLTFIFPTEDEKNLVVEKLKHYEGGPAEALIAALTS